MRNEMSAALASALVALGGSVGWAQTATIDGTKDVDGFYGVIRHAQAQPTRFGDNRATPPGNPATVTTGIEIAIPLAAIGNPAGPIRVAGFVNGGEHDFASNQFLGGFIALTNNLGEPRNIDLALQNGNQFVSVPLAAAAGAPTIDGTRDGVYVSRFVQSNYTGFGDASTGTPGFCNGSEIDATYTAVFNNTLYIFLAGNLESNGNDLEIFIDTDGAANGQGQIRGDNPIVDPGLNTPEGALNRMGGPGGANGGLKFDDGLSPDYYLTVQGADDGGGVYQLRAHWATLPTAGAGTGYYLGATGAQSNGVLTGGDPGSPAVLVTIDNSNIAGVTGIPGSIPSVDFANGSELDNLFARVSEGRLFLFMGGNLESNWNNLELFLDVQPGGQNTLRTDNVDIDFNGLNRMGGMTFDADFAPDWWFSLRTGGTPIQMWGNAATLRTDGPLFSFGGLLLDYGAYSGGEKASNNPLPFPATRMDDPTGAAIFTDAGPREAQRLYPTFPPPGLIRASINNMNTGGVTGPDPGNTFDAPNVATGLEVEVNLQEAGWDGTSPIKLLAMINGGGHGFVSNQLIPSLPNATGGGFAENLGNPATLNFTTIAGDQFIVIDLVGPTCPGQGAGACSRADWNEDGVIDFNDFLAFLNDFNNLDDCADLNGDGVVDFNDFLEFLNLYNAGC
ncbi:MAG: EF-hand domain-containing protein [Phycisphaerae bacterium]|nr:EF-hand domain-containing protein [Phycisphaerae bacterium]